MKNGVNVEDIIDRRRREKERNIVNIKYYYWNRGGYREYHEKNLGLGVTTIDDNENNRIKQIANNRFNERNPNYFKVKLEIRPFFRGNIDCDLNLININSVTRNFSINRTNRLYTKHEFNREFPVRLDVKYREDSGVRAELINFYTFYQVNTDVYFYNLYQINLCRNIDFSNNEYVTCPNLKRRECNIKTISTEQKYMVKSL